MSYLISLILKDEGLNDSNDSNNTEAVVRRCSVKKVYLEISQNSQENTCARFSFFNKVAGRFLGLLMVIASSLNI